MVCRVLGRLACLLVFSAVCAVSAHAQTFQGSFTGSVKDETGAVIAGAVITIVEQDKGLIRSATTGSDGLYRIALLPPGRYRVTAEKPGFAKTTRGVIQLAVNLQQEINFTLKVGSQSTTITVEATPGVVDTQTASVGTTISETNVDQVPLNGRQFLELALLAPGVVPAPSGSRVNERSQGGAINVNGLEDSMNSYWLDGLDNTTTGVGQYTVAPPLDSVQEFRMETGVYEAKFGAHAGAQVNVVTKSGTNEFHGTAYDFLRNTVLDARNYFDPSVPPMHRNQFGGTVGGPLEVPEVYDGHDRTFFFFSYEGLQQRRDFFRQAVVPTVAERSGDFSDLLACPQPVNLSLLGQPIPGNNLNYLVEGGLIPSLDPVGQQFVDLYPTPTNLNAGCGNANYLAQLNQRISYNTYMGRVDHHWGSKDSIFFRYNLNFDREFQPSGFYVAGPTNVPGYGTYLHNQYQMAGFDWTHAFTPTVINEFKFGYNRWQIRQNNQDQGNTFAQQLGIQGLERSDPDQLGIPNMTFTGYDSLGSNTTTPESGAVNTFQLADTVTQVHGNHLIAYGADLRSVMRGNFSINSLIRGQFDFLGAVTGNSVADALLGLPTDWINGSQEYISGHLGEYDFFGQDTWKVSPKLTLNLGLRYEYKGLTTDKYNRMASFDFSSTACGSFGLTTGALLVAGVSAATVQCPSIDPQTGVTTFVPVGTKNLGGTGENRSLQYPDKNNLAPRLGIAWQPFGDSRTVVRTGFGLFYNQTFGDVYFQKGNNPPFVSITAGNLSGAEPALCVPAACQPGQIPIASGVLIQQALVGVAAPVYPTMSPFQINFADAVIQEWNFDLQRELPHSWLFDIGYVGTRGLHLPRQVDPNQPMNLTSGGTTALAICQTSGCPRPYPLLSGFSYTESSGSSIYQGLQAKVEHHYANGIALIGSYTYSKSIDTVSDPFSNDRDGNFPQNSYNLAAERALSDFDFRHRAVAGYVYDLPFGYRLWKSENSRVNYLIQGWQLSGVFTAESGPHFTPIISANISGANESATSGNPTTDRPDVTGSSFYPASKTPNQWVLPSAFSAPAAFTFGDAGRNILNGQGLNSWDFSVIRRFKLTESRNIEFRAEMFNIFNRANFDIPVRELDSASFGKILNTVLPVAGNASGGPGDPREVQLALKLSW
jgi:Carboxypeptidase regulatory-like domain/TonB dependent receptor-like, beta-barrel